MKTRAALFLLAFTSLLSWARQLPWDFTPPEDATQPTQKERAIYHDFKNRLEAAVASREPVSVATLYQTNGVSAVEWKSELARWRPVLEEGARPSPPFLKILSQLPPESHDYWEAQAHRLTRHQVTAFAIVRFQNGFQMALPMVLVGDKLLIVPSGKRSAKGIEPGGATDGSQPSRSGTN